MEKITKEYKLDLKIKKKIKLIVNLVIISLLLVFSVLLFDLKSPNILFSKILIPNIVLIFILSKLYIVSCLMNMHLEYKKK